MAQINKPSEYFNTKLYTGNGSTQSITGVGFQPDWVWTKNRTNANSHQLYDAVRGVQKALFSNGTDVEETNANFLTAFNSDGFSVGSSAGLNGNGTNVVSWNWLGANSTVSNTAGTITSTVSANTTSGFSIVSWTGNSGTVGHGLGVKPAMIIIKSRQTINNWVVVHKELTGGMDSNVLILNAADAETGVGSMVEPTSSVFTIVSGMASNDNQIGYVFAEKKGFSKFGKYTGNGSADGPFIYTGFKPSFILLKNIGASQEWEIYDNKRIGYNPANYHLDAHDSAAESALSGRLDLLSNGWKIKVGPSGPLNTSGNNYIYMAFAENPLVGTNNIPATAR